MKKIYITEMLSLKNRTTIKYKAETPREELPRHVSERKEIPISICEVTYKAPATSFMDVTDLLFFFF